MERIERDGLDDDELPPDASDREVMAGVMSRISEDAWCAGWNSGLEYDLWAIMTGRITNRFGFGPVDERTLKKLRALHEKIGGWVIWVSHPDQEDGIEAGEEVWSGTGNYFVTNEEWVPMFEEWATKMAAQGHPLRVLTPEENAQYEAESEASIRGGEHILDFKGRDAAVQKLREEKGWKPLEPYYDA